MTALKAVVKVQGAIARFLYRLAWVSLATFTLLFNYEVFSRYVFLKPTVWAQDIISILVCTLIFLALPYITKENKHLVIDVFVDFFPKTVQRALGVLAAIIVAAVLALVGYFAGVEAYKQFLRGTMTASALAIPKWPIVAGISLSFLSACFYQLANLFTGLADND